MTKQLWCATIGHAARSLDELCLILARYAIDIIIDIRSTPYSRFAPQFNRESLRTDLQIHDVSYLFLGDCLGGRPADPRALNKEGRVDYGRLRELPSFQRGIERVRECLAQGFRPALMCAERDPFWCHRFVLVGRALTECSVAIEHVLAPGESLLQQALAARLLARYGVGGRQPSLFDQARSHAELLGRAYEMHATSMAARQARARQTPASAADGQTAADGLPVPASGAAGEARGSDA